MAGPAVGLDDVAGPVAAAVEGLDDDDAAWLAA